MKACGPLLGLVVVCCSLLVACHSQMKQVNTDFSDSKRQGSPPLCFDYRGEAQATAEAGVSNIWAYLNNTCSYTVDCVIYDDATEKEQRVAVAGYKQLRFLLGASVPAKRVHLKLTCGWNP